MSGGISVLTKALRAESMKSPSAPATTIPGPRTRQVLHDVETENWPIAAPSSDSIHHPKRLYVRTERVTKFWTGILIFSKC
jgi:hypothetical protein